MPLKDTSMNPERMTAQQQGWDALAAAIIEKAIADYRVAIIVEHDKTAREIEHFFRSPYFANISMIDPEWLIKKCREKFTKEKEERNEKKRRSMERKLNEVRDAERSRT